MKSVAIGAGCVNNNIETVKIPDGWTLIADTITAVGKVDSRDISKTIRDKDGVEKTTDYISRGKVFCPVGISTTTVSISWAASLESIQIEPIGNWAGSIYLYEVWNSSFSIVNSALDDGTSVYWTCIVKE